MVPENIRITDTYDRCIRKPKRRQPQPSAAARHGQSAFKVANYTYKSAILLPITFNSPPGKQLRLDFTARESEGCLPLGLASTIWLNTFFCGLTYPIQPNPNPEHDPSDKSACKFPGPKSASMAPNSGKTNFWVFFGLRKPEHGKFLVFQLK